MIDMLERVTPILDLVKTDKEIRVAPILKSDLEQAYPQHKLI